MESVSAMYRGGGRRARGVADTGGKGREGGEEGRGGVEDEVSGIRGRRSEDPRITEGNARKKGKVRGGEDRTEEARGLLPILLTYLAVVFGMPVRSCAAEGRAGSSSL